MSHRRLREAQASKAETGTHRPMLPTKSSELFASVKPLASLSAAFLYLAEAGHDRLTINQAAFFLLVAAADARGRPLTLMEVMENTEGVLGRSIQNSYKVLLEPHGRNPKDFSLGWLFREPDADDERRKFLRLTDKGKDVAKAALLALGEGAYADDMEEHDGPARAEA